MKIFYAFLTCICLIGQTTDAKAANVFDDAGSFTLAKAVKIGRSNVGSSQIAKEIGTFGQKESYKCLEGSYLTPSGCKSCGEAIKGCAKCTSATECTACEATGYVLANGTCEERGAKPDETCGASNTFSWNANGKKSVPAGYKCIDGYGANAAISIPGNSNYNAVNIRFWDYATVTGTFETTDLKSLHHYDQKVKDLDAVITFDSPVTVNGTVYLQEADSSAAVKKGISMKFKGGLNGSPKCVVKRMTPSTGCGWASCTSNIETTTTCTCTTSECKIDSCPSGQELKNGACVAKTTTCNVWDENNKAGLYWNANGAKTIPAGIQCWNGYGMYATITVPDNSVYDNVTIRFWDNASVTGSFTTRELASMWHTAGTLDIATSDTILTFKSPVKVTGVVYLQQSSKDRTKGMKFIFEKGLTGSMKCAMKRMSDQYGHNTVESTDTCTCTKDQCSIDAK